MSWVEFAQNHLVAAKRMCKAHPGSSVSRAYYAAHVLLADALISAGYVPSAPYETAPHRQQPNLVGSHLASQGTQFVTDLGLAISRLYKRRLDADYSQHATVDSVQAKEAIRDSAEIFALLKTGVKK